MPNFWHLYNRTSVLIGTPWKINMEPTNHPWKERKMISSKPPWGHVPAVNLPGCKLLKYQWYFLIWVFSKNSGTPKSSILIGFSIINHPFWGTPNFWKHPFPYMTGWHPGVLDDQPKPAQWKVETLESWVPTSFLKRQTDGEKPISTWDWSHKKLLNQ